MFWFPFIAEMRRRRAGQRTGRRRARQGMGRTRAEHGDGKNKSGVEGWQEGGWDRGMRRRKEG